MFDTSSSPEIADSAGEQTQFGNEAWLYDPNKQVPQAAVSDEQKPSFWQTFQGRIIIIAGSFILVLIFIAAMVMWMRSRRAGGPGVLPDQTPIMNLDLGPLGDKVKALTVELKAADPTKELDPFPPLSLEARLDEPEQ